MWDWDLRWPIRTVINSLLKWRQKHGIWLWPAQNLVPLAHLRNIGSLCILLEIHVNWLGDSSQYRVEMGTTSIGWHSYLYIATRSYCPLCTNLPPVISNLKARVETSQSHCIISFIFIASVVSEWQNIPKSRILYVSRWTSQNMDRPYPSAISDPLCQVFTVSDHPLNFRTLRVVTLLLSAHLSTYVSMAYAEHIYPINRDR